MAKKLTGMLNLSKIPKELLFVTKKQEKAIFIDIVKKREPDQYGNTYTICLYDKNERKNIFLGDLKEQEYGSDNGGNAGGNAGSAPASEPHDDLPF